MSKDKIYSENDIAGFLGIPVRKQRLLMKGETMQEVEGVRFYSVPLYFKLLERYGLAQVQKPSGEIVIVNKKDVLKEWKIMN